MKLTVGSVMLTVSLCLGQYQFGVVCSTDNRFATGPNNSHKLAFSSEILDPARDTVTLVFQSQESIYICFSGNSAPNPWSRPVAYYPGNEPAIAYGGDGNRHLVWVMIDTITRALNIFYRVLEYRMLPINVSFSGNNCHYPDVFADEQGVAHIVWAESLSGSSQIYYQKADVNGRIGERFLVSSSGGYCLFPSIEKFGDTITVIWQEYEPSQPQPYSIVCRRQVNAVWLPENILAQSGEPLAHPSLDFSPGNEGISACWDFEDGGNLEVRFYGGNPGGGFSTPGASTAPVMATVGGVWSYYFWEEEAAGVKDIYSHFYYFMSGWSRGSLRQLFMLNEPVYAPNCLGALVVWTQGESAPYKVMWGFFGYPISIAEPVEPRNARLKSTIASNLLKIPDADRSSYLLDITGRKVMRVQAGTNDLTGLKPGIYYLQIGKYRGRLIVVR